MKRGLNANAYTIVEVLIVMAVTGALFVSVVGIFTGQQNRTEFSQAINDIDAKIRDTIGNVSNGYYVKTADFGCQAVGSGQPLVTAPNGQAQGEHNDCIFIGRVLQFAVDNDQGRYNNYNVIAQRVKNNQEVTNLADAYPEVMGPNTAVDATERNTLLYGLTAVRMYFRDTHVNGNNPVRINSVAFISTLPGYTSGNLNSGTTSVQLMPVYVTTPPTPDIAQNQPGNAELLAAQNVTKDTIGTLPSGGVPDGGVTICFQSGGTDQYGVITIGSNNRQLTTTVKIQSSADALAGDCSAAF